MSLYFKSSRVQYRVALDVTPDSLPPAQVWVETGASMVTDYLTAAQLRELAGVFLDAADRIDGTKPLADDHSDTAAS